MLKSFTVFRLPPGWKSPGAAAFAETLSRFEFRPCAPTERVTAGWVPPRGVAHAPLAENVNGQVLMKLMVESRLLPSSAVRADLDERLDALEAQTGRRPRGRAKKELKEQIEHELLPRAFTRKSATLIWLNPKARLVVLGTTTAKTVDLVIAEMTRAFEDRVVLQPLHTALSPAVAMASWLQAQTPPQGFGFDRDCELRTPDDTKATVRYVRHGLDNDGVVQHIEAGKVPVQLGMSWSDKLSFVLTDEMRVKRLKFLDVEATAGSAESRQDKDEAFDGDAALMTGELSQMLGDLLDALGGEAPLAAAA